MYVTVIGGAGGGGPISSPGLHCWL